MALERLSSLLALSLPKQTGWQTGHRAGGSDCPPHHGEREPDLGAPRTHGELLKLGFEISERTVSRYLARLHRQDGERSRHRRNASWLWLSNCCWGWCWGLGVTILLAAAELAGQLVAQISGLALAEVLDPEHDAGLPVMSKLMNLFTVAIYVLVGGGTARLMAGLLDTFATIPPGTGRFREGLVESLLAVMGQSFSLALSAAAPMLLAVLLATLILGMIGRTLPQLNILSVGFGLNTMAASLCLTLTFGSIAWLLEHQLRPAISLLLRALAASAPADLHA